MGWRGGGLELVVGRGPSDELTLNEGDAKAVVCQGVLFATRGPTLNYVCPLSEVAVALQETTAALPPRCGGRQGAGRLQAPGGSAALKQEERD
ncbi:unnamed protein product [Boreogadus saida]